MATIPKASIHDLLNLTNNSTHAQSATMNNKPYVPNPVGDFIQTLVKYAQPAVKAVQNNQAVKDILDSPVGQLEQGHFNNVIPAGKQLIADANSGKYRPQINFDGEMELMPGMGIKPGGIFNPATEKPSGVILGPDGNPIVKPKVNTTASMVKDENGNLIPNPTRNVETKPQANYAYDNKPTEPINPNGEKLPPQPQVVGTQTPPSKPHPEVSDNPIEVTDRTGKHPVTGGNPVLVDLRNEAKRNPYYLEDQEKSRQVLDKFVSGNTPLEVEKNLPLQLQEETQRIKNIMASKPNATAKIDELIESNEANLKKVGISPGTSTKADTATREALVELDNQIAAKAGITGKTEATGEDLVNYKKILDDKLQSAYKKEDNGTSLTPAEHAMRTLRKTINDKLKQMYPGMGDALDRQSAMIDARSSVAKAAGQEEAAQVKTAGLPKDPGFLHKYIKPVIATAIGTSIAGGYGLSKLPIGDFPGALSNIITGNIPTGKTSQPKLNTTPSSHMRSDDIKKNTGLPYTYDDYQKDMQSPQYVPGSNFKALADQKMANTNAIASQHLPGNVSQFMGGQAQQALDAQSKLQNVNLEGLTGVFKRLGSVKQYAAYVSNPENPYAQEIQTLDQANGLYVQAVRDISGSDPKPDNLINPGDTAEMIKEKLEVQNKFINDTYKKYQPFWDAKNPTSETTSPQVYNQNTGGGLPNTSGGGLPAIPQGFSMKQMTP